MIEIRKSDLKKKTKLNFNNNLENKVKKFEDRLKKNYGNITHKIKDNSKRLCIQKPVATPVLVMDTTVIFKLILRCVCTTLHTMKSLFHC